eukprot:ANDGO_00673.mRNA.1 Mitogen-activated protein kinase KSS1
MCMVCGSLDHGMHSKRTDGTMLLQCGEHALLKQQFELMENNGFRLEHILEAIRSERFVAIFRAPTSSQMSPARQVSASPTIRPPLCATGSTGSISSPLSMTNSTNNVAASEMNSSSNIMPPPRDGDMNAKRSDEDVDDHDAQPFVYSMSRGENDVFELQLNITFTRANCIAHTNLSKVWRCSLTSPLFSSPRPMAIKMWEQSFTAKREQVAKDLQKLQREIMSIRKLCEETPHVVRIESSPTKLRIGPNTYFCLLMELCKQPLSQYVVDTHSRSTMDQFGGLANSSPDVPRPDNSPSLPSPSVRLLDDAHVRSITSQILAAVDACHRAHISHRDIKPDNILVSFQRADDDRPLLKLCDFGFSKIIDCPGTRGEMQTVIGTDLYRAPEIDLKGKYEVSADMWSVGCVLYFVLMGGTHLFDRHQDVLDVANTSSLSGDGHSRGDEKVVGLLTRHIDIRLQASVMFDLLRRLLRIEPTLRIRSFEACKHPATWSWKRMVSNIRVLVDCYNDNVPSALRIVEHVEKRTPSVLHHCAGDWLSEFDDTTKSILTSVWKKNPRFQPSTRTTVSILLRQIRNMVVHMSESMNQLPGFSPETIAHDLGQRLLPRFPLLMPAIFDSLMDPANERFVSLTPVPDGWELSLKSE